MAKSSVHHRRNANRVLRLALPLALAVGVLLLGAPAAAAAASLTPSPPSQGARGTVTLSGSGFASNSPVTFTFDGATINPTAPVTTDGTGSFSGVTITVPSSALPGPHTLSASDGTPPPATAPFNVDAISVSPTTGAPDSPLVVTGAGWPAGDDIQTQIGGSTVCQLRANPLGQISGDQSYGCRVPPNLPPGSHPLTARDLTNHLSQATGSSFMVPSQPPVAAFTPTFATVLAGSPVAFDGTLSSGTISSYRWSFGDGSTSTSSKPIHTYFNVGTFVVSLTVIDSSGNKGTVSHQITVIAPPPLQTLVLTPLAAPAVVRFGPVSTTRSGIVKLGQREFCPGPGPGCTVTIIATSRAVGRAADAANSANAFSARPAVRVARSVIKIGSNRSAALTFKLSKAAQAVLRKAGTLPVRIKITTIRGNQVTTRTLKLTLR